MRALGGGALRQRYLYNLKELRSQSGDVYTEMKVTSFYKREKTDFLGS
jgi:hypothetical protein